MIPVGQAPALEFHACVLNNRYLVVRPENIAHEDRLGGIQAGTEGA